MVNILSLPFPSFIIFFGLFSFCFCFLFFLIFCFFLVLLYLSSSLLLCFVISCCLCLVFTFTVGLILSLWPPLGALPPSFVFLFAFYFLIRIP